jgi:hypothetical protein
MLIPALIALALVAAVGIASAQADAILNAYARGTSYAGNATVFVKLHTGDPGAAGATNAAANTTRVQATFGAAASGGALSNTAVLDWLNVPNAETYSHVSLWTASSGGTFLGSDALAVARTVAVGDNFQIGVGEIDLTLGAIAA